MRAITIWQPWAHLVVQGIKKMETRSWATLYRGPLLIHAAGDPRHGRIPYDILCSAFDLDIPQYYNLSFGAIIGCVEMTGCEPTQNMVTHVKRNWAEIHDTLEQGLEMRPDIDEYIRREKAMGIYDVGNYFWTLENPILFDKPIKSKGFQKIWNVADIPELVEQLPASFNI